MKKTFTKVVKAVIKSRPQIAGVHYTNERIEVTDAHVAMMAWEYNAVPVREV